MVLVEILFYKKIYIYICMWTLNNIEREKKIGKTLVFSDMKTLEQNML